MTASAWDPAWLRRVEAAHYRLQRGLYCPGQAPLPGATLFFNPQIADPEWNHAALISAAADGVPALLAAVRQELNAQARGAPAGGAPAGGAPARAATLAISPFSRPENLAEALRRVGWTRAFLHRWLLFPAAQPTPQVPSGGEIAVVETRAQMERFIQLFTAAFAGVPGGLSPGYAAALRASFAAANPAVAVVHYLASVAGEPAAVATRLQADGFAGFYNLGVLPKFRRQGLGARLNAQRIRDARAAGGQWLFLQTEEDQVAAWQLKQGFELGFTVAGWSESCPPG